MWVITSLLLWRNYIENGITSFGFTQLNARNFDDIGLTDFGKNLLLKTLEKIKC